MLHASLGSAGSLLCRILPPCPAIPQPCILSSRARQTCWMPAISGGAPGASLVPGCNVPRRPRPRRPGLLGTLQPAPARLFGRTGLACAHAALLSTIAGRPDTSAASQRHEPGLGLAVSAHLVLDPLPLLLLRSAQLFSRSSVCGLCYSCSVGMRKRISGRSLVSSSMSLTLCATNSQLALSHDRLSDDEPEQQPGARASKDSSPKDMAACGTRQHLVKESLGPAPCRSCRRVDACDYLRVAMGGCTQVRLECYGFPGDDGPWAGCGDTPQELVEETTALASTTISGDPLCRRARVCASVCVSARVCSVSVSVVV